MSPKSLFTAILKVLGLFFLRDFLSSIPGFLSLTSVLLGYSDRGGIASVIDGLLIIGVFGYVAYVLLFRTGWVIEKLRLTQGFDEASFSFNIHRSTVLSIAVIVIGALMVVNTLPGFLRQVFLLFQEKKNSIFDVYPKADKTLLIVDVVQIITGLLLLGNVQKAVSCIELKRRKTSVEEEAVVDERSDNESGTDNGIGEAH